MAGPPISSLWELTGRLCCCARQNNTGAAERCLPWRVLVYQHRRRSVFFFRFQAWQSLVRYTFVSFIFSPCTYGWLLVACLSFIPFTPPCYA